MPCDYPTIGTADLDVTMSAEGFFPFKVLLSVSGGVLNEEELTIDCRNFTNAAFPAKPVLTRHSCFAPLMSTLGI